MRNGASAQVYGSNIELNIAPSNAFSFQAGGTLQRTRYSEDQLLFEADEPADNVLTRRFVRAPNTYGYLNSNWKATAKFALDLTGVYTGSMLVPHVQEDESVLIKKSPDFMEINLRLGYTFAVKTDYNIEVFGGVQNIFNAYQKDFDLGAKRDSDYIYGPSRPRTFTLGLRIGHFH